MTDKTPATEAGLDAAWDALWADLQHTSLSHEPVGLLPSGAETIARHRLAIEAEAREQQGWSEAEAYAKGRADALREAAERVRGWLSDQEWPHFGPAIGRGPFDPGRMAARAAAEQCLAILTEQEGIDERGS